MSIEFLKVKRDSLAAEARIIRRKELSLKEQRKWEKAHEEDYEATDALVRSLARHRREDVRSEARVAQLAIAFLSGKSFEEFQGNSRTYFPAYRFHRLIEKYGTNTTEQKQEALAWSTKAESLIRKNEQAYLATKQK